MISDYLYLVFVHCKSISQTSEFRADVCRHGFRNAVAEICTQLKLESELTLQNKLLNLPIKEAGTFLNQHPFLELFYLLNSLDEINADASCFDELGRFTYASSYQKQYQIAPNRVLDLILETCRTVPFLKTSFVYTPQPASFFLSHDIDSLYGSTLQDGLWAVKNFRPDVLLKLFANCIQQKPHWFNIDQIMNLESEYDFRSTFYWLVNRGKIDQRQSNADYSISSPRLQETLQQVKRRGFENGLHKSISEQNIKEEAKRLPGNIVGNRYHYLKFRLPQAYEAIESSGLSLDASLGFAEKAGFRNCYSFPFSPYNFIKGEAFHFLEVPLTLMDGTFHRYAKVPVNKTAEQIISFIENFKENALLSILWHNTFFTQYKYKGYLNEYKKILAYLYEAKLNNLNQTEIIKQFCWKQV